MLQFKEQVDLSSFNTLPHLASSFFFLCAKNFSVSASPMVIKTEAD